MAFSRPADSAGRVVHLHATTWLLVANLVGLLSAWLLLVPAGPEASRLFNYGRLAAVHANLQLYGWCALALAGLLIRWYSAGAGDEAGKAGRICGFWSAGLAFGMVSWLLGHLAGKPFMEWTPPGALVMALAMAVFWGVLAEWLWVRRSEGRGIAPQAVVLAGLALVPAVFLVASQPWHYPSVNPHSGGATGTSLLRSTLGIIAIYGLAPRFLKLRPRRDGFQYASRIYWIVFALACVVAAAARGGHESHKDVWQVALLGSLLVWIPLLPIHLSRFAWPAGAQPWLGWGAVWWALLVGSGFATFLAPVLDRFKFTHFLVAHSHLAMAGVVTCYGWAFLHAMDGAVPHRTWTHAAWNGSLALHLGALGGLAWIEAEVPGALYSEHRYVNPLLWIRLLAGFGMTVPSLYWLARAWVPGRPNLDEVGRTSRTQPLHR